MYIQKTKRFFFWCVDTTTKKMADLFLQSSYGKCMSEIVAFGVPLATCSVDVDCNSTLYKATNLNFEGSDYQESQTQEQQNQLLFSKQLLNRQTAAFTLLYMEEARLNTVPEKYARLTGMDIAFDADITFEDVNGFWDVWAVGQGLPVRYAAGARWWPNARNKQKRKDDSLVQLYVRFVYDNHNEHTPDELLSLLDDADEALLLDFKEHSGVTLQWSRGQKIKLSVRQILEIDLKPLFKQIANFFKILPRIKNHTIVKSIGTVLPADIISLPSWRWFLQTDKVARILVALKGTKQDNKLVEFNAPSSDPDVPQRFRIVSSAADTTTRQVTYLGSDCDTAYGQALFVGLLGRYMRQRTALVTSMQALAEHFQVKLAPDVVDVKQDSDVQYTAMCSKEKRPDLLSIDKVVDPERLGNTLVVSSSERYQCHNPKYPYPYFLRQPEGRVCCGKKQYVALQNKAGKESLQRTNNSNLEQFVKAAYAIGTPQDQQNEPVVLLHTYEPETTLSLETRHFATVMRYVQGTLRRRTVIDVAPTCIVQEQTATTLEEQILWMNDQSSFHDSKLYYRYYEHMLQANVFVLTSHFVDNREIYSPEVPFYRHRPLRTDYEFDRCVVVLRENGYRTFRYNYPRYVLLQPNSTSVFFSKQATIGFMTLFKRLSRFYEGDTLATWQPGPSMFLPAKTRILSQLVDVNHKMREFVIEFQSVRRRLFSEPLQPVNAPVRQSEHIEPWTPATLTAFTGVDNIQDVCVAYSLTDQADCFVLWLPIADTKEPFLGFECTQLTSLMDFVTTLPKRSGVVLNTFFKPLQAYQDSRIAADVFVKRMLFLWCVYMTKEYKDMTSLPVKVSATKVELFLTTFFNTSISLEDAEATLQDIRWLEGSYYIPRLFTKEEFEQLLKQDPMYSRADQKLHTSKQTKEAVRKLVLLFWKANAGRPFIEIYPKYLYPPTMAFYQPRQAVHYIASLTEWEWYLRTYSSNTINNALEIVFNLKGTQPDRFVFAQVTPTTNQVEFYLFEKLYNLTPGTAPNRPIVTPETITGKSYITMNNNWYIIDPIEQ